MMSKYEYVGLKKTFFPHKNKFFYELIYKTPFGAVFENFTVKNLKKIAFEDISQVLGIKYYEAIEISLDIKSECYVITIILQSPDFEFLKMKFDSAYLLAKKTEKNI